MEAAESMYSSFHGVPSTVIDEYYEKESYHGNLAALGSLVGLKVRTVSGYDVTLGFESGSGKQSNPLHPRLTGGYDYGDVKEKAKGLRPGDFVKVIAGSERFWVLLTHVSGSQLTGTINNHLENKDLHGLKFGDKISFSKSKIADVQRSNPEGVKRKSNAFWPFDSFNKTTIYHVPSGHKFNTVSKHGGHTIYKSTTKNGYVVPSLDRDSVFDSPKDAKKFIDHWTKHNNPKKGKRHGKTIGPVAASQKFVGDTIGAIYRPMNEFIGTVGGVVDKGFKKVGIKGNPYHWPWHVSSGLNVDRVKVFEGPDAKAQAMAHAQDEANSTEWPAYVRKGTPGSMAKSKAFKVRPSKANPRRSNPDHVLLCSTENGKNLSLIGGDQSLDLDALKIDGQLADKELVTVGEVWGLNYRTEKVFGDGGSEDGLTEYIHILGPKETKPSRGGDLWQDAVPPKDDVFGTGELPTLVFDKRNKKILLSGGMYRIDQPLMGTSAGIEN